jgi:gamma-glutamyltranspeptidase / glutathione hydrolase
VTTLVQEQAVDSRWFAAGAVASPHHLASAIGSQVLAADGNAVDAAVAANLALAVLTPYHCGAGGDLLATVWDGRATGVASTGSMPAGATPETIRAAVAAGHGSAATLPGTGGMPTFGALPVTVPGAVAGWFDLLERFGTRSFGDLVQPAIALAREGFPVSAQAEGHVVRGRRRLADRPGWEATFGGMRHGRRFVQPDLAASLALLADEGPDALYGGRLGERILEVLQRHGSTMAAADLRAHRVSTVTPVRTAFRDLEVLELPPPTQGVTALTALGILDRHAATGWDEALEVHREIEATRLALRDRQRHLGDARSMRTTVGELLASDRLDRLAGGIDDDRAADLQLLRPGAGGTAALCAADRDGLAISLVQSNFVGFGSGVIAPGTGIGLHNRGAHLTLDGGADEPNAVAPGAVPLHTLIPAMTVRDGAPVHVFGTMGGDGQAQTHVQLLRRWVDRGVALQEGIDAPRWMIDLHDGAILIEDRAPVAVIEGLRARGHEVRVVGPYEHVMGHAHALRFTLDGYEGASDPRCEGAVTGS